MTFPVFFEHHGKRGWPVYGNQGLHGSGCHLSDHCSVKGGLTSGNQFSLKKATGQVWCIHRDDQPVRFPVVLEGGKDTGHRTMGWIAVFYNRIPGKIANLFFTAGNQSLIANHIKQAGKMFIKQITMYPDQRFIESHPGAPTPGKKKTIERSAFIHV